MCSSRRKGRLKPHVSKVDVESVDIVLEKLSLLRKTVELDLLKLVLLLGVRELLC